MSPNSHSAGCRLRRLFAAGVEIVLAMGFAACGGGAAEPAGKASAAAVDASTPSAETGVGVTAPDAGAPGGLPDGATAGAADGGDAQPSAGGGDPHGLDGGDGGVTPPPDPDACLPYDPQTEEFPWCGSGSGNFGHWVLDDWRSPAYSYELDQEAADIARWTTSGGQERRDHWFQIGNDRLIAMVSNEGFAQVFARERGPVFLNRVDLAAGRTGGGYSYIKDGEEIWASAYALRGPARVTRRQAGIQYAEHTAAHNGIEVTHLVFAPAGGPYPADSEKPEPAFAEIPGGVPFLVDDVTITNTSAPTRTITHLEFWDVNRHPLELQLVRTGKAAPGMVETLDAERNAINQLFTLTVLPEPERAAVRVRHTYNGGDALPPGAPSGRDFAPYDIVFARLSPAPGGEDFAPVTRRKTVIGNDAARPAMLQKAVPPEELRLDTAPAGTQPAVFAEALELTLAAGERVSLRYAYGQATPRWEEHLQALAAGGDALAAASTHTHALRDMVATHEDAPFLPRETAWHAAQLTGAAIYDDYFEAHTIVQGSAYMYLHGLDGAARDFALFAVPLAYFRPDLARDCLRTMMRMTYADGHQISYAVQGFGMVEDAVIHYAPSDLDLFFLWGLTEYVFATGDREFLAEMNPYWPKTAAQGTTLEHAQAAVRHLIDAVGLGPHGLIRVGTGDWSDGIVLESKDVEAARAIGESVPNTQMAAWVLPRAAALFDDTDPALAAEMRAYAAQMRVAAEGEWHEQWYRRAWFGPEAPFGEGHLNLEAQIWALIAEIPPPDRRETLIAGIREQLDLPSPVGAMRVPGGELWHAITALLTWGYGRSHPEFAFESLTRHTLHAYATANPDQWYGIWSGPDALGIHGGTWSSPATPMTDFPAMNANQHALPLIALLRYAGIEPVEGGLRIAPRDPKLGVYAPQVEIGHHGLEPGFTIRYTAGVARARTTLVLPYPKGCEYAVQGGAQGAGANGEFRIPVDLKAGATLVIDSNGLCGED